MHFSTMSISNSRFYRFSSKRGHFLVVLKDHKFSPSVKTESPTWLADSDALQVGLLDVVEVLHAGNVEVVSDADVELLQLDFSQQLVQPLSVLVHQHDLAQTSL